MKKLILISAIALCLTACKQTEHEAVVLERIYTPSISGTGISTGGNLVFVSTPETFTLLYRDVKSGEINSMKVTKEIYFTHTEGTLFTYNSY